MNIWTEVNNTFKKNKKNNVFSGTKIYTLGKYVIFDSKCGSNPTKG
jgi:wobble nucleotide-excising tRNase